VAHSRRGGTCRTSRMVRRRGRAALRRAGVPLGRGARCAACARRRSRRGSRRRAHYAYGDALEHAELVLALWAQVPDAEELTGMRHVDMVRYTATQAEMSGSTDRALDYIRSALVEVDPVEDAVTAGLLHERFGRYLWILARSWSDILEHCHEAVRLVPDAPSPARAKVRATLGQQLMLAARNDE